MDRALVCASLLFGASVLAGCGGGEDYRYEMAEPEAPEAAYANEVFTRLQEMKRSNRSEGPDAIDTIGYIEGMEGYGDEPPVGQYGATYDAIHAGVREIQKMVETGKSQQEIDKKLDELITKASVLPHAKGAQATPDAEAATE